MRTLLLMRHAKSSWDQAGVPDHDRSLKKRGKRDALRVGWFLETNDLVPQLIISSTAERASSTATLVAHACGYTGKIVLDDTLYHAGPMGYMSILQSIDDRYHRVLVIGHNPEVELLLEVLTGLCESMRTSTLARIELPIERWAAVRDYIGGELGDLWHRNDLKTMAQVEGVDLKAMAQSSDLGHTSAAATKEALPAPDMDL